MKATRSFAQHPHFVWVKEKMREAPEPGWYCLYGPQPGADLPLGFALC